MIIYNNSGGTLLNIQVDDKSYRYRSIMKDNSVTLYYSIVEHVELQVGSYIEFQGERYTLWRPENFKKHSSRNFEYTVTFGGNQERLKKVKYKLLSSLPRKLKFDLVGNPALFIDLLVDNLNAYDSGWTRGSCIEAAQKNLAFNHESCYDVLNRLAEEFDTEWEIAGKTINFCKVEKFKTSPVTLSYGKGNGFRTGVGRVNEGDKQPVNLLYVQGGEKNIDFSAYGSKTLLLPSSQRLSYNGKVYVTDEHGMYITRSGFGLNDVNEDSMDCSDIYPMRVGTVSSVIEVGEDGKDITDEESAEGEEKKKAVFYDFTDSSIPEGLDFSKYRIVGEVATVIFQSGMLAGKEFELEQTQEELTGYIHKERRFKLRQQEYDGVSMPSAEWNISPGDEYAVFNITLPSSYVCDNGSQTGASWDMFREAARYFSEHEESSFTFSGELDPIHAKKNWLTIGGKLLPGGYVLFSDTQFQPSGILIRITGVKDYINKPYSPQLELSNLPVSGTIMNDLGRIDANEVTTEELHKDSISFTKRRFRDAKETLKMLQDAFLNFSGSIDPITIRTMQLLIGDESLQYRFVNNKTNPETVPHVVTYDPKTKILHAPAGIIQHMTLGINSLSSTHNISEYHFWDMREYASPPLVTKSKAYYLYAKVSRTDPTGDFLLSETAIKMKEEEGCYHLLVGILNSEYEGTRSFVELYGFTEILPGRITTDRVVSADGLNFIDFVNNAFRVGNSDTYIDFNTKGDGKFRIKGAIIQSESGDESPIGSYRGEWDSKTTYFKGDEVTYNDGETVSTYRYMSDTPRDGIPPSNTQYWILTATGGRPGVPGNDGVDGKGIEFIFRRQSNNSQPDTPTSVNEDDYVPSGWTDDQQGVTAAYPYEFVSKRIKVDDSWGVYSIPRIWATFSFDGEPGADGKDGTDYEFIFYRTTTESRPATPSTSQTDDYVPSGWTDDAQGVTSTYQYEWVSKRVKTDGVWSGFSTPALWSKYSFDGADGDYYEYRFAKNGSRTSPPALDVTSPEPVGWSTMMPEAGDLEYIWMTISKKKSSGELLQNWSKPMRQTPVDAKAEPGPVVVYRGVYDSSKKYYGSSIRVDAVKYNNIHYVARIDPPTPEFTGHAPTGESDDLYWNNFGAEFESVATELLLAEWANIAGLIFKDEKLYSQDVDKLTGEANICIDGRTGEATFKNLKGLSGEFTKLSAGDIGSLEMGNDGRVWMGGDWYHQGGKDGRNLRLYAQDIWCRGGVGSMYSNALVVEGNVGYYYTNGLNGSNIVSKTFPPETSEAGVLYYTIPLYGEEKDSAGFPVDLLIIRSLSGVYRYVLSGVPGKKVTVVNGSDKNSDIYIYSNGFQIAMKGGCVAEFVNVNRFLNPVPGDNVLGRGWLYYGWQDNNWG